MAAFNPQNDNCMDFEGLLDLENIPSFSSNRCQPWRVRKVYYNLQIEFKYMLNDIDSIHVSTGKEV